MSRKLSTRLAVGLLNSSARTGAMAARIATRFAAKSSGMSKENQKLITNAVDSGTKTATKGINYATSTKAQDDVKATLAKSKAALANPQESLQVASQKATEYGNQAYAKINNPENQQYAKEKFTSFLSNATNLVNKAKDTAKNQYAKQINQSQPIAPAAAAAGGKSRKFYKKRRTQKRSMKIHRNRNRKSRKTRTRQ